MKAKVFMRLARNPGGQHPYYKVAASGKPNPRPLTVSERELHTLHFALELDIPDELLAPAKWPVIEVALDPELATRVPLEVEVGDGRV